MGVGRSGESSANAALGAIGVRPMAPSTFTGTLPGRSFGGVRVAWVFMVAAVALGLGGCANVAPWQRAKLAHPTMTDSEESPGRSHLQALQEGASGGSTSPASGCGCN